MQRLRPLGYCAPSEMMVWFLISGSTATRSSKSSLRENPAWSKPWMTWTFWPTTSSYQSCRQLYSSKLMGKKYKNSRGAVAPVGKASFKRSQVSATLQVWVQVLLRHKVVGTKSRAIWRTTNGITASDQLYSKKSLKFRLSPEEVCLYL